MKSRRCFLAMLTLCFAAPAAFAQPKPPEADAAAQAAQSKVVAVTVYADRALVTRRAELDLAAGERTLVFGGLPARLDPSSVQVSGAGAFTLRDVRVVPRQTARDVSAELVALQDRKKAVEDRMQVQRDRIKTAEAEREFVKGISARITSGGAEDATPVLEPDKWAKMLDFYRARLNAVDADIRAANAELAALQLELSKVNREIASLGSQQAGSSYNDIEAAFDVAKAGRVTVSVSYVVLGSSWRPDYALRASSATAKVALHYQALVAQNTGEDWSEAALSLSTARPNVGGSMPELDPWTLDLARPAPKARESSKRAMAEAMPSAAPSANGGRSDEALKEEAMAYAEASAESGATAVTFNLPGKSTIPSDGRERKLTIAVLELSARYSYASVPKLSPFAFFKATVTNATELPLLAGETHVFVDGAYVADAAIDSVPPGGEFEADLGVDEGVSVERKLVKKFDENTGIVSKRRKTTYQYEIVVKNGKAGQVSIVVYDQLPVSANAEITVKAIAPQYSKDTDALKKGAYETFEWNLTLAPKAEAKLPLSFSVEYPRDVPIVGLE